MAFFSSDLTFQNIPLKNIFILLYSLKYYTQKILRRTTAFNWKWQCCPSYEAQLTNTWNLYAWEWTQTPQNSNRKQISPSARAAALRPDEKSFCLKQWDLGHRQVIKGAGRSPPDLQGVGSEEELERSGSFCGPQNNHLVDRLSEEQGDGRIRGSRP